MDSLKSATAGGVLLHEDSIAFPVRDRKGRDFTIRATRTDSGWTLEIVTPGGVIAGIARLTITDHIARLDALSVWESVARETPAWLVKFLSGIHLSLPRLKCRRCGLGSLLLIYGLKLAHDNRLSGIQAHLPDSLDTLRLFRNLGFSAQPSETGFTVWHPTAHKADTTAL